MNAAVAVLLSVMLTLATTFPASTCGAAPAIHARACPCCATECACVAPAPAGPVSPDAVPPARDRVPAAPDWLAPLPSVRTVTGETGAEGPARPTVSPLSAEAALPLFRRHCALLI